MVFSSPAFLLVFLPAFFLVLEFCRGRATKLWFIAGSWIFYGIWRVDFLLLLVLTCLCNWLIARAMWKKMHAGGSAKPLFVFGIALNLAVLAFFKYANFGVSVLSSLLVSLGAGPLESPGIILPIGISFYIFQAISYLSDLRREFAARGPLSTVGPGSFADLAAYISLFPQLIAGPIIRYSDVALQIQQPHRSPGRSKRGLQRFLGGLAKKVLLADAAGSIADAAFALQAPGTLEAWLGVVAFSVQLYLDFAAYSDMAIGLGLMLGLRFAENFDRPYASRSISEFWRRWHISLSSWLRDYLYIPLGGNRLGSARTYVNLILVMALGGLWHGASWNFLIWGLWHGLWLLLERAFRSRRGGSAHLDTRSTALQRVVQAAAWCRTMLVVSLGWVFFRAADLSKAAEVLFAMFAFTGNSAGSLAGSAAGPLAQLGWQITSVNAIGLAVAIVYIMFEKRTKSQLGGQNWIVLSILAILAALKIAAQSYSPFLYFQF